MFKRNQYFFEKKLGSGGYGAVYLARNKQTGRFNKFLTKHRCDGGCESNAERKNY